MNFFDIFDHYIEMRSIPITGLEKLKKFMDLYLL